MLGLYLIAMTGGILVPFAISLMIGGVLDMFKSVKALITKTPINMK
jgi:hypothetical protein